MTIYDNNSHFISTTLLIFFIYYGNICYIKNSVVINEEALKFANYLYQMILYKNVNDLDDEIKNLEDLRIGENLTPIQKYEDKYLREIRKLNKDFVFVEVEQVLEFNKTTEFFNKFKDELLQKNEGIDISGGDVDIMLLAKEQAREFIIEKRLEKLKDCFVIEKTPLGNVLMTYNVSRGSFQFYSDNTIPYRYLETVSRKFVKFFDCRPIYYDMEEELKNYEIKLDEKEMLEKEREKERSARADELKKGKNDGQLTVQPKKNVFAKFKSYNKESGTGHVNMAAPPKNSMPSKSVTENNPNTKILLKENANRYTYEGKFSNFNMLKKVDKKLVDKKMALSFSDFKKMQAEINNEYLII
jgi:hypothetical protein